MYMLVRICANTHACLCAVYVYICVCVIHDSYSSLLVSISPALNSSLLMNFPHSPQGGPSSQVDSCRHSPGLPKTP